MICTEAMPAARPRSSLSSILGVVVLSGFTAVVACQDSNGGDPPIRDVGDLLEVQQDIAEDQCECFAEAYGDTVEACLEEVGTLGADEEACLSALLDGTSAFDVLRCQAEALRDYTACELARGCPTPFTCTNGQSIPADYVCDGEDDCGDDSDERQGCPDPFTCDSGHTVPSSFECDAFEDCADGSDEQDCPAPFTCSDGESLPVSWVCDGFPDCSDGADERQDCPESCQSAWALEVLECGELSAELQLQVSICFGFTCGDGEELPGSQVCDGVDDCADGTDELGCDVEIDGGSESSGG